MVVVMMMMMMMMIYYHDDGKENGDDGEILHQLRRLTRATSGELGVSRQRSLTYFTYLLID